MNKHMARRIAFQLIANLVHADLHQDSWLQERISAFLPDDQTKIYFAVEEVVEEIERRGGKDLI